MLYSKETSASTHVHLDKIMFLAGYVFFSLLIMQFSNYFDHCAINSLKNRREWRGCFKNQKILFDADNQYKDMDRYLCLRFPYETKTMVSLQRENENALGRKSRNWNTVWQVPDPFHLFALIESYSNVLPFFFTRTRGYLICFPILDTIVQKRHFKKLFVNWN